MMFLDAETIPNYDIPTELWPLPKYGNTKAEDKRAEIDKDWKENGQIKAMATDIRLAKLVSLQFMIDGEIVSTDENDEVNMLKEFWYYAKQVKKFVGFNIFDFDIPLVINRSMLLGVKSSVKIPLVRYKNNPVYDIFQIFTLWGKKEWVNLDYVLKWLGMETKTGAGSEVYKRWVLKDYAWIHKYCRGDIKQLPAVYEIFSEYY